MQENSVSWSETLSIHTKIVLNYRLPCHWHVKINFQVSGGRKSKCSYQRYTQRKPTNFFAWQKFQIYLSMFQYLRYTIQFLKNILVYMNMKNILVYMNINNILVYMNIFVYHLNIFFSIFSMSVIIAFTSLMEVQH